MNFPCNVWGLTPEEYICGESLSDDEFRAIYQAPQAVRERDSRIANRARAQRSIVEGAETLALTYRNTSQECVGKA
jgi:uncharacterized membrane protein